MAMAINYELPDAPDEPADYVWCESGEGKCGRDVLTRASFIPTPSDQASSTEDGTPYPVKKRTHHEVESPSKRPRIKVPSIHQLKNNTRAGQHLQRQPCVPTPASALALVQKRLPEAILSAILSPASLCNCIELIKAWRSQSTRIELASESKDMIAKILVEEGLDVTIKARTQLKERVRKARKLFQICQGFDRGLLCLLPFVEVSESHLYNMTTAEIDEFHTLAAGKKLDIAVRCKIGMLIQHMFTRDVEFVFEAKKLTSFNRLPEFEMVALLQPISYPEVNSYTPDSTWEKPPSWPWEWNPSSRRFEWWLSFQ
jgi:hypothetical protein